MKKTLSILVFLFSSIVILAQSVEYQTFIYTNDDLANEIQSLCEERNSTRSYMGDLFNASKESVKGIASGYVTSFIDLGVNAIGSFIDTEFSPKKMSGKKLYVLKMFIPLISALYQK